MLTFLFSFTEDGIMFIDGQQSDVLVVYDVLRVFEAVVDTQEVFDCCRFYKTAFVAEKDVEDFS